MGKLEENHGEIVEFTRLMGKTQVGQKVEVNILKNDKTQSSIYLSTKEDKEVFLYMTDKDKCILIPDDDFEYPRKDKDGPAYLLNEKYTFLLGDNVLNLIGPEYSSEGNEFIASMNDHEKFVMYRTVYNKLDSQGKPGYKWFVDLFDKMVGFTKILLQFDEKEKTFTFDIIWPSILEFKSSNDCNQQKIKDISFPHNRIIFGAPGTGKSFRLNQDKELFGERYERVTFHPNYSYSQFVGTYKPTPKRDENDEPTDDITYKYVPGPFMRAYVEANKQLDEPYLLLIEEINRANVSAVFGDIFQLLDRKEGESEFEIETSEDMRDFLKKEMKDEINEQDFNYKKMKIPKNMFIWATMNSADQGVFPMDAAFKRRWEFEYIGINDNVDGDYNEIKVKLSENTEPICWNELRTAINNKLSKCNVNEDKLIGPFFISKEILDKIDCDNFRDDNEFIKTFKSKLLMYLFEDAGKHCIDLFGGCEDKSKFSSILNEFKDKGEKIFGEDILDYADK